MNAVSAIGSSRCHKQLRQQRRDVGPDDDLVVIGAERCATCRAYGSSL